MPTQVMKSLAKTYLAGTKTLEKITGRFRRRVGYSQFGEDLHLRSFYDRLAHDRKVVVSGGCVVDVGAFRPIVFSNTYTFYRQGWRGINIDPTPGSMRLFDKVRPRDTNLEVAIATVEGAGSFFLFGTPSVWNTMDSAAAELATKKTGITPQKIEVKLRRLETILDEHLKEQHFEILSIDAEGYDLEILQSNNFEKYAPRLILVENSQR